MQALVNIIGCFLGAGALTGGEDAARYVRQTSKGTVIECTFTLRREERGWSIRSVTGQDRTKLSLLAQFDARDRLTAATVTTFSADRKRICKVEVADGKARVHRDGKETKEFAIPPGVIVTSAPDWTDTFLLCRRYDRARGGKQTFPGLWIHPEKEPLRLTFTIEGKGEEGIEHDGKKQHLRRFEIRLRNNDAYAAWADAHGRMIKLQPLQRGAGYSLVLEGYEKSAAGLRAQAP